MPTNKKLAKNTTVGKSGFGNPDQRFSELLANKTLFWDVDQNVLDKNEHRDYIISRVLESGRLEDVYLLLKVYSDQEIIHVVKNSRQITPRTAFFWKNYYKLADSDILCIQTPSRNTPAMPWQR